MCVCQHLNVQTLTSHPVLKLLESQGSLWLFNGLVEVIKLKWHLSNKYFFPFKKVLYTKPAIHSESFHSWWFLTFKVNFLHQKSSESFFIFFIKEYQFRSTFVCYWHFWITSIFKSHHTKMMPNFRQLAMKSILKIQYFP